MKNFFSKNFYPTPEHVILMMGIDCDGKTVLEPSAGKGDIVEYLHQSGAKAVLTCEKHPDLAEIIKSKSKFLKHDFFSLTASEVSHIDLIVANPPFDHGDKHLLYMWEIAPEGCEIICLLNSNTFKNDYSRTRGELKSIIKEYGSFQYLGDVYTTAERETDISIGLVKLFKPKSGNNEFEGFFMDEEPEERQENGIMQFDGIRDIVQRYIGAVKIFDEHSIISNRMSELTRPFGIGGFSIQVGHDNQIYNREDFKKALQKKAWNHLFNLMNFNKYLTTGVMKDINKFVEQQVTVPFTMKNIYKMFEIIIGTRDQIFDRALEEAVDKFTMHTHENRFNVEGWKTNAGYMLNEKFIIERMAEYSNYNGGYVTVRYGSNQEKLDDLIKVLHSLTGTVNENKYNATHHIKSENGIELLQCNTWYNYLFFEVKMFKKGTMHLKFKDKKVWEILNRRYAKIKGEVLPEKFRV